MAGKLTAAAVLRAIDDLIDRFGTDLNDEDFIAALEEMEEHAKASREARQEELGES